MLESSIPLLVILFLALFGSNYSVFIAALILLLIKWLGFEAWLAPVETHGISVGITILTMAILVPIAQGKLTTQMLLDAFKSPVGLVAILPGGARGSLYAGNAGSSQRPDRRHHCRRLSLPRSSSRPLDCRRFSLSGDQSGRILQGIKSEG